MNGLREKNLFCAADSWEEHIDTALSFEHSEESQAYTVFYHLLKP